MKKLMLMVAVALVSAAAVAAQCKGVTQKGERCKREAAEGSNDCIGHANQAPKTPPKGAVEKDDGTCWAITETGTRCKHKKVIGSDYCTQHAPNVKPAKPVTQCRAMTWFGKQCSRKPVDGYRYCRQHLGKGRSKK